MTVQELIDALRVMPNMDMQVRAINKPNFNECKPITLVFNCGTEFGCMLELGVTENVFNSSK
jgi:hypothetical protein